MRNIVLQMTNLTTVRLQGITIKFKNVVGVGYQLTMRLQGCQLLTMFLNGR